MKPQTFTWKKLTADELTRVYLDEMRRDFPPSELKPLSMILNSEAVGMAHTWGEAMAARRLGFYARCGAVDTGWTEHLFDAWFRVLVLPAEGETLDAETANKELADCYSRVMGADKWRRYVRLYRPDGTEEKF